MALLSAQAKDLPHGLPGHRAALPLGQRQREGAVLLHRGLHAPPSRAWRKSGVLALEEQEVFRRAMPETGESTPLSTLNDQQQAAYQGLLDLMEEPAPQAALLYGVTGSGKTQVYLHLIQKALEAGRGAIVMVPEIALTPSLLQIFLAHFGRQVAVLHSCLPSGRAL